MDVTNKCIISGKYGFDLSNTNRFAIIYVRAKNGDTIKINNIEGIIYNDIFVAYEQPMHEDHPIIDRQNKIIVLGGMEEQTLRTVCIIGK